MGWAAFIYVLGNCEYSLSFLDLIVRRRINRMHIENLLQNFTIRMFFHVYLHIDSLSVTILWNCSFAGLASRKKHFIMMPKAPSLVDLCVNLAVDNVRYLGDVGETDAHLLERVLCHCTLDQLMHIEKSTVVRCFVHSTLRLLSAFLLIF